ncbi:MAG: chemotaxis-specific protein-glutamate methyltransferase CheB [Promethearchaeota archaeon]
MSSETISVIIADDSEFLRKSITNILSTDEKINIADYAKNGIEAVKLVKKYRPDVLILDLIMPEMNGLDAFKEIMDYNPTPTIILSAVNPQNMDTSIQALLMGAFDYVIKPGGLGAKNLPRFKEELLAKVLLASKSQIKKIFATENNLSKKTYIRQELVSETFKFGKYINKLEPIKETEKITQKEGHTANKPIETIQVKIMPEIKEINQQKEPPVKIIKEPIKQQVNTSTTTEVAEQSTKTVVEKPKNKIKSLDRISKSILKSKIKRDKVLEKTNLTPFKGIHLVSNVIVIGASVGGPRTLKTVFMEIPNNISCPILVVQHLSDPFINSFINSLNEACDIYIKVGVDGEFLQPGVVYFAPGGKHMEISVKNNKPCIRIFSGEPVHYCIPSIDVLFFSACKVFRKKTMGILLTGMGEDGVDGLEAIKRIGGKTIAESQETCVLYGMPRIAIESGAAQIQSPSYRIPKHIADFANLKKIK